MRVWATHTTHTPIAYITIVFIYKYTYTYTEVLSMDHNDVRLADAQAIQKGVYDAIVRLTKDVVA